MNGDGTYESAVELLNALYDTFGEVRVKQWGDHFDTELARVDKVVEPPTVVVRRTVETRDKGMF